MHASMRAEFAINQHWGTHLERGGQEHCVGLEGFEFLGGCQQHRPERALTEQFVCEHPLSHDRRATRQTTKNTHTTAALSAIAHTNTHTPVLLATRKPRAGSSSTMRPSAILPQQRQLSGRPPAAAAGRTWHVCCRASLQKEQTQQTQQQPAPPSAVEDAPSPSPPTSPPLSSPGRRTLLLQVLPTTAAAVQIMLWRDAPPAAAAAVPSSAADLEGLMPDVAPAPSAAERLPKAYTRTMRRLVQALRASIDADADASKKEAAVRRAADPAKELVREFVGRWRGNVAVAGDVTHDEMAGAIAELGAFYQANGPRARLSGDAKERVLARLRAVEAALPPEEKSLLGL